ncbi:MAG: VOC family protein [Bacteroidota bacterium]|nr:VOC family protein [Bacteroidota bacterium]
MLINHPSIGQNGEAEQGTISLNHLALHVHDLEKSKKFYETVVGLKSIPEPFKDGFHEWFSMGGKGQLHLIGGAEKPLSRNKNNHLCFTVKSIDAFITNLESQNIEWTNWAGKAKTRTLRVDGVTQIYFVDPDGYWIELNNDGYINKK